MPPSTSPVSPPLGRGPDSIDFLASHGLIAHSPPIRSSDYELGLTNPFFYYLIRRLGIVPAHSWSAALSRGSWVHRCFEKDPLFLVDPNLSLSITPLLEKRLDELTVINQSLGIVGDSNKEILTREREDAEISLGWYSSWRQIKISDTYGTFPQYLTTSYWRILGNELPITSPPTSYCSVPRTGILDMLLYHQKHNTLWVVDLKTCSESPIIRLSTCLIEFQTQHYLSILQELVQDPAWRLQFNLPDDITVGGMMHIALRKPSIGFCDADRNFRLVDFTPTRGKNKGITRQEKEYFGEPLLSNYIIRCRQWCTGTGDYLHLAPERVTDPVVNISFSPVTKVLDPDGTTEYTSRLNYIEKLATIDPVPSNFLTNPGALRSFGKSSKPISKYAPFVLNNPRLWPDIMKSDGFIVAHREQETTHVPEEASQET